MKYLSVCSGIEAATVAWHGLGWKAAAYSEIEPFPSAVLAHHYPDVLNVGDMTKFKEWNIEPGSIDLLVGGTPCQSFSVAGLRKGLDDPRGNLMLTYLAIARQYRPRWLVWENVPGVLSSNGGLDFASLLRGMGECGYGFAYRILDAQYFGVPQRRRRVFVIGYLGNWRAAAAVLFERHSLSGHPAPSREKGKEVAASTGFSVTGSVTGGFGPRLGTDESCQGSVISQPYPIANTLTARMHKGINSTVDEGQTPVVSFHPTQDPISSTEVCHSIGANENATAAVMQPIGVFQDSEFGVQQYDSAGTLRAGRIPEHQMVMQPVYEMHGQDSRVRELGDVCSTVSATYGAGGGNVPVTLQPIPLNSMNALRDANADPSTGCGIGEAGEAMFTITKGHSHAVAHSVLAPTLTASNDPSRSPQSSEITAQVAAVVQATAMQGVAQPMVLMDQGGSVMNVEHDITGTLRRETHGHEPVVIQPPTMQVRRLTPVECERLQGFPTVSEKAIIQVCLDPQNHGALAALKCHKWQNSAWPADANGLMQPASIVVAHSNTPPADQEPLAALHVQLLYGHKVRVTRNAGRSILYVSGAEASEKSPQHTQIESIAAELAPLLHEAVNSAALGKAASPHSIRLSFPALSGATNAEKSGQGTEAHASGAVSGQTQATFTTSDLGLITSLSDSTAATLCCSALRAIAGCIPSETLPARFSIELTVESPYTAIPWRKKPADECPDGPRYKALGNSMAVPVMAWIGKRIQEFEAMNAS